MIVILSGKFNVIGLCTSGNAQRKVITHFASLLVILCLWLHAHWTVGSVTKEMNTLMILFDLPSKEEWGVNNCKLWTLERLHCRLKGQCLWMMNPRDSCNFKFWCHFSWLMIFIPMAHEKSANHVSLHLFVVQGYYRTHELCFLISGNFYLG
jgi:hypothetical protein